MSNFTLNTDSEMTDEEFFAAHPQPKLKNCVYLHRQDEENYDTITTPYFPTKHVDNKKFAPIKHLPRSQPIIESTQSLPKKERHITIFQRVEKEGMSCDMSGNTILEECPWLFSWEEEYGKDNIFYYCENIMPDDIIEPKE